jgi:hypothetical protein
MQVMELFPRLLQIKVENGKYPLNLVLQHEGTANIAWKILQLYPPAAKEQDDDGQYPLHLVFYNKY